jgi:hypothetical protein
MSTFRVTTTDRVSLLKNKGGIFQIRDLTQVASVRQVARRMVLTGMRIDCYLDQGVDTAVRMADAALVPNDSTSSHDNREAAVIFHRWILGASNSPARWRVPLSDSVETHMVIKGNSSWGSPVALDLFAHDINVVYRVMCDLEVTTAPIGEGDFGTEEAAA